MLDEKSQQKNAELGLPPGTLVHPPYFMAVYLGKKPIVMKLGFKTIVMNAGSLTIMPMKDLPAVVNWNGGKEVSETFVVLEKGLMTSPLLAFKTKAQMPARIKYLADMKEKAMAEAVKYKASLQPAKVELKIETEEGKGKKK